MNVRTNLRLTALAMMLAVLGALVPASHASAQPPRGPLSVTNNTDCPFQVCSANAAGCVIVPAHQSATIDIPCNTSAVQVRGCGQLFPLQLGNCIDLRTGNDCCSRICFVPGIVACTFFITVNPIPFPCPCPPEG